MTHTELKQVILDYIRETYKREYVGKLDILDLEPEGYKVSFYLNKSENPSVIIADLPDDEFIPFIKEEIRKIKFYKTRYFELSKILPIYLKSCCNERERIN